MVNRMAEEMFHNSVPVMKKAVPVKITGPYQSEQKIVTLESDEQIVHPGNYVVEGIDGEKYPITSEVFAEYEPCPRAGNDMYIKKKKMVRAYQVDFKGQLQTFEGETLHFDPGYYIVMESPNKMWPVKETIFKRTYEFTN